MESHTKQVYQVGPCHCHWLESSASHLGASEHCYSRGQCWDRESLLSSADFRDDGIGTAVTKSKENNIRHEVPMNNQRWFELASSKLGHQFPKNKGKKTSQSYHLKVSRLSRWTGLQSTQRNRKKLKRLVWRNPTGWLHSDQTWMVESTKNLTAKGRGSLGH